MKLNPSRPIEFIAVGSELLSPYFPETNSLFIAERLQELGWQLTFKSVVSDRLEELKKVIRLAKNRSWLIIISGGLGPTEDDRTRQAVAEVLGRQLIFKREILEKIRTRFESRGLQMTPSNRRQAYIIKGAEILDNPNGTAPGMWLENRNQIIILLPGPPAELQPMVENLVLPRLRKFSQVQVLRSIIRTTGAGESWVEDRIRSVYQNLPPNLELTTLASPGDVQLWLTMPVRENLEKSLQAFEHFRKRIIRLLGQLVYSENGDPLERVIGQQLQSTGKTLACAESCSGGLLAHRITSVPGSSVYFLEGLVTYSNQSKGRELKVSAKLIKEQGAVSPEVAKAMAVNLRRKTGADFTLSTTGIAGPGGGSDSKPVGLVFIGLTFPGGVEVKQNSFRGDRQQIKFQTTQKALDMLRLKLIEAGLTK
ncbi:MAG: competence/damage-inducible protein A [Acidobacteriota bacterium]|nr:competence/damage-inducible protein A [Acidobacteriota bacterium]MDW3228594.1 competence/damage-inducible protein A [Acidobacteriota bacterium]